MLNNIKWNWNNYRSKTKNDIYYLNPYSDRIIETLENFWSYRFEKAFNAIWKRNLFVLFGTSVSLFFILLVKLLMWILSLFSNYKALVFFTKYPILQKNIFKLICWILFLFCLFLIKLFVSLVKLMFIIILLPRALAVVRINLFNRR